MAKQTIKVGIVGGTGYTGVELLRLLAQHPHASLRSSLRGRKRACRSPTCSRTCAGAVRSSSPSLRASALERCDIVFFATPNGVAMNEARALYDAGVRMIDIAADFRI